MTKTPPFTRDQAAREASASYAADVIADRIANAELEALGDHISLIQLRAMIKEELLKAAKKTGGI